MTLIVCELSTNHRGELWIAEEMIVAAVKAGADIIKTQHYLPAKINASDPQRDWLTRSALTIRQQKHLKQITESLGATFMSTPFCKEALTELRDIGLTHFKIASSESRNDWWTPNQGETWFVSFPWGRAVPLGARNQCVAYHMTAIPLYPTPLECIGQAGLIGGPHRSGWSDHCEGISACLWAIANGAHVVEVHFKIEGQGRSCVWDKSADDLKRLRAFADDCQTMSSGVSTRFRTRWSA